MIFEFSNYRLEIDVEKTRQYYQTAHFVSESCSCGGCRNFEKAVDSLPMEAVSFFTQFGINMKKIQEAYVNCANADNSILYGGFYHLCGKIISGANTWITIYNKFEVALKTECDLLDKDFPRPAVQLEISANIPWVLAERHDFPNLRA